MHLATPALVALTPTVSLATQVPFFMQTPVFKLVLMAITLIQLHSPARLVIPLAIPASGLPTATVLNVPHHFSYLAKHVLLLVVLDFMVKPAQIRVIAATILVENAQQLPQVLVLHAV